MFFDQTPFQIQRQRLYKLPEFWKQKGGVIAAPYLPSRFSASHLEFFGLMWLSHHHECDFLDSVLFILLVK